MLPGPLGFSQAEGAIGSQVCPLQLSPFECMASLPSNHTAGVQRQNLISFILPLQKQPNSLHTVGTQQG